MKVFASLITLLPLIAAITIDKRQAACVTTCLSKLTSSSGMTSCGATDIQCLCKDTGLMATVMACLQQECAPADLQSSIQYGTSVCEAAGVPVSIPASLTATGAGGAASTPAASGSAPASAASSASGAASSASGAASSAAAGVSASASSAVSAASSAASSVAAASSTSKAGALPTGVVNFVALGAAAGGALLFI